MKIDLNLNGAVQSGERPLLRIGGQTPFELFESQLGDAARRELDKLDKASKDVESVFVKDLMKRLTPKGAFGTGMMGDFLQDQFQNALADTIGDTGSFGIAKMLNENVRDSILRQEAARLILEKQGEK